MPRSPLKPCPRQYCNQLIPPRQSYCPAHQQQAMREWDATRGTAASRGYDARHRRWRQAILSRDRYCRIGVKCRGEALATVADHIIPLRQGGTFSLDNGQGACDACHNYKRATADRGRPSKCVKRAPQGGQNLPEKSGETGALALRARRQNGENAQNAHLGPQGDCRGG